MVCRDARTNRAREVHPLVATTPEEKRLFALGERMFLFIIPYFPTLSHLPSSTIPPLICPTEMKNRRLTTASKSLDKVPPTSAEAASLHAFWLKYRDGVQEGMGYGAQLRSEQDSDGGDHDHVRMGDTVLEKCLLMFPQERK